MKQSLTVGIVVLALAGSAGVASAKVKPKPVPPVCNLTTDPTGDANGAPLISPLPVTNTPVEGGPSDDAYDITSADVATDAKTVTSVVRVKKLATSTTSAPTGIAWTGDFTAGGFQFLMIAEAPVNGAQSFTIGYISDPKTNSYSTLGAGTGVIDLAKSEVRISAPLAMLAAKFKITPGTPITGIGAAAGRDYDASNAATGNFSAQDSTDTAMGTATYKAGAPSCVIPGK